jgi:hypothetical protein
VLGAWSRGEQREADQSGQALSSYCGKRRERASPSDQQREEKTHGAATACATRGGQEAGGVRRSGS